MHRSSLRGRSSLCCTNQAEMYCPQNTLRRVWHPCHTHATHLIILPQMAQMFRLRSIVPRNTQNTQKFSSARKFCEFCGSTFQQEASVCSVNSVGRCNGSSVGAAETAAPPGWVRVAALNNPPTDGTDAHRCLGCVVLFHGTRRIHRSLLLWEDAVAALLVHLRQLHPLGGCVGMAGCHTLL